MCQSEPGGVPGLAQCAGVDAGLVKYAGGGESRPWRGVIRPWSAYSGLPRELIWPGPGIPAWPGRHTIIRPSRGRKEAAWRGFLARPDSPNPAGGWRPARGRGPTGAEQGTQPERESRPSQDEEPAAHPGRGGLAGRWPTRGAEAWPGGGPTGKRRRDLGPAGEGATWPSRSGARRPARDEAAVPAQPSLFRPGPFLPWPS
jgi:hypothetical protein